MAAEGKTIVFHVEWVGQRNYKFIAQPIPTETVEECFIRSHSEYAYEPSGEKSPPIEKDKLSVMSFSMSTSYGHLLLFLSVKMEHIIPLFVPGDNTIHVKLSRGVT